MKADEVSAGALVRSHCGGGDGVQLVQDLSQGDLVFGVKGEVFELVKADMVFLKIPL